MTLGEKPFNWGLEPSSALRLAFQSDTLPTEPSPPAIVVSPLWPSGVLQCCTCNTGPVSQWCVGHMQHRASQPVVCWTHATQGQSASGVLDTCNTGPVSQWCVGHMQHRASQPVVCWTHATQGQSASGVLDTCNTGPVSQWCVGHMQHRASQPVVCWTHATQSQSAVG